MKQKPSLRGLVLVWSIYMMVALAFFFMGGWDLYRETQFESSAVRSMATIERLWTSSGGRGGIHYHVNCRYPTLSNRDWRVQLSVTPETYQSLRAASVVPVKYLLDYPGVSQVDSPLEEQCHWRSGEAGLAIGFFFAVFGCGFFWQVRRKIRH